MENDIFITDGGLETTLVYHKGIELPYFAAFDLLKNKTGILTLKEYFQEYAEIATRHKVGMILDSPTWRANQDWGTKLGYSAEKLQELNQKSIDLLAQIRNQYENKHSRFVISGCIGPRGDGYNPKSLMTAKESEEYHIKQIQAFEQTDADMITALTINYPEEAIGIALAAKSLEIPVAISFTVETNGKLVTGQTLQEAITLTEKSTNGYVSYYMINCAHPIHFEKVMSKNESWLKRIRGLRANSSTKSHAELDNSAELDEGDPVNLANHYKKLRANLKHLNILGGCCGTDQRHIQQICCQNV